MNLVDVLIVVILILAAVHGVTQGAAMQVLSFGGFWIGLVVGAAAAPLVSHIFSSTFTSAFATLAVFFGFALVGGAIGRYFGTHAWGALQRARLGKADSAAGAIVAVVAALAAVWLITVLLAAGPTMGLARAINESAIVRTLDNHLPEPTNVLTRLQAFVNTTPFPRVFSGLEPPTAPVKLPDDPAIRAAVRAAGDSTVRVEGFGCGGVQTGSGFVAGDGLVVTNAHVVAGIRSLSVYEQNGRRHRATTVYFDSKLDLAVLRTAPLGLHGLAMLRTDVGHGAAGAVLGYPGGTSTLTPGPAAVIREIRAVGPDIYGHQTQRNVYQLNATIRQGNSGGPFVRQDGTVLGVIFAASTNDPHVGYALTSNEVASRVDQARENTAPVDTKSCAA